MKKTMRHTLLALAAAAALLLVSCNAEILSKQPGSYEGQGSRPETDEIFNGDAPKNVWASPAYYSDRIIVSFDSVPGADYYEIFKAEAPRDAWQVDYEDLNWVKTIYDVSASAKTRIDYADLTVDSRSASNKLYYYTVRAGNYKAGITGDVKAKFSDPVMGWTLNPPRSLEVSQGVSEEYVELKWTQVNKVKGYRIYYSTNKDADASVWTLMQDTLIPAPVNQPELVAKFIPPKELLGKDLFFTVSSVSLKADESDRSGIRNGYTFLPGAPLAPEGLRVSNGDSAKWIDIAWDIPKKEAITDGGYTWEIFRVSGATDPELVATFSSEGLDDLISQGKAPEGLSKDSEGTRYVFRDTKGLEPGVEYDYSVRATCLMDDPEDPSQKINAIGKAANRKGYITGPSLAVTDRSTEFPSEGNSGSFSFTIAEAPKGWNEDRTWQYRVYGRNSVKGTVGSWMQVGELLPVTGDAVTVTVPYDPEKPVNEFSYSVIDGNGDESKRYDEIAGSAIVTKLAAAPDISYLTVKSNTFREGMTDNNGVYPVVVELSYDGTVYSDFYVEALKAETPNQKTESAGELLLKKGEETILSSAMSPAKIGEKWSYRIKGVDVFGRGTEWSSTVNGYGAVKGRELIKYMERYALKPWEFVGEQGFPARLNSKWDSNSGTQAGKLHGMIDSHGMGALGEMTIKGDYHDGTIYYWSGANGFAGDVTFKFNNFGELPTIYTNGEYRMIKVSASGSGDTVTGTVTIGGMYPATVDFGNLKVRNYAFTGNYRVTFDNGQGTMDVTSAK